MTTEAIAALPPDHCAEHQWHHTDCGPCHGAFQKLKGAEWFLAYLEANSAARAALAEWLWPAVVEARAAVVEMVEWNHDHGWSVPYHIAEFAVTRPPLASGVAEANVIESPHGAKSYDFDEREFFNEIGRSAPEARGPASRRRNSS